MMMMMKGCGKMMQMNFFKCPLGTHKGESWEKIRNRAVGQEFTTYRAYKISKHKDYIENFYRHVEIYEAGRKIGVAKLTCIEFLRASEVPEEDIMNDTFPDWGRSEFHDFMYFIYGLYDPMLAKLTLEWVSVE